MFSYVDCFLLISKKDDVINMFFVSLLYITSKFYVSFVCSFSLTDHIRCQNVLELSTKTWLSSDYLQIELQVHVTSSYQVRLLCYPNHLRAS